MPALSPARSPRRRGGAARSGRRTSSGNSFGIETLLQPSAGAAVEALLEVEVDIYDPQGREQHVRLSFDALGRQVDVHA